MDQLLSGTDRLPALPDSPGHYGCQGTGLQRGRREASPFSVRVPADGLSHPLPSGPVS